MTPDTYFKDRSALFSPFDDPWVAKPPFSIKSLPRPYLLLDDPWVAKGPFSKLMPFLPRISFKSPYLLRISFTISFGYLLMQQPLTHLLKEKRRRNSKIKIFWNNPRIIHLLDYSTIVQRRPYGV